jgi:hypothetical protein
LPRHVAWLIYLTIVADVKVASRPHFAARGGLPLVFSLLFTEWCLSRPSVKSHPLHLPIILGKLLSDESLETARSSLRSYSGHPVVQHQPSLRQAVAAGERSDGDRGLALSWRGPGTAFLRGDRSSMVEFRHGGGSSSRADAGLLAGVIFTGGMLGPFLMLWGLERLSGVLTSLLLNLEALFTVLIAILVFREHLVRLELAGVLVIVVGAGVLMYRPGAIHGDIF